MGILKLDTDRVMTVEEAYKLYGPSNGSVSYGGFLNLLQNHAIGKNIIISDTYSLGVTIISDLEFTPQKYKLMNGTNNAPGFRYIANIEWYKMTLI